MCMLCIYIIIYLVLMVGIPSCFSWLENRLWLFSRFFSMIR